MFLLQQAAEALTVVFDPLRFLIIMVGVGLGLVIGVIPGIGGLVGMALLLPFTYAMDPYTALAFLIGMWSVAPTSDTIPSILLGVPGGAGSAATVMDGYPMARRGEGGSELGGSHTASVTGGLLGTGGSHLKALGEDTGWGQFALPVGARANGKRKRESE